MGAKEFGSVLRKLIPATVREFKKLKAGDPYYFDHWADDRFGAACMYYWFASGDGSKKNRKRVLVSEVHTAFQHLRTTRAFDRKSFRTLCPISYEAGPCGFAVTGRILEELGVAGYSDHQVGFTLTDPVKAASLFDCPT
jgi:hypothetical protein